MKFGLARFGGVGAVVVLAMGGATSAGCSAAPEDVGLESDVALAVGYGQAQNVVVYLKDQADLSAAQRLRSKAERGRYVYGELVAVANHTQTDLLAALAAEPGIRVQPFHIVNAVLVENASPALVRKLAARPDVSRVSADTATSIDLGRLTPEEQAEVDAAPTRAIGDNITSTGADRVWNELGVRGEGIVVAGQDTGYAWAHGALKSHYRGWDGSNADHRYSWHDSIHAAGATGTNPCGFDAMAPCDDQGHGTHTMGTIVGDDGGDNKIGMAPGAKWIGCRNMNKGKGKPSTYLECFEFFLAPYPQGTDPRAEGRPEMAPDVINNSWGCDGSEGCRGTEFVKALGSLQAAGVFVVASAGNSGSGCGSINAQPATVSDATLSVGAHNHRNGTIASFSSRGPSSLDGKIGPDVTAPGVSIRSSVKSGGYESGMWSGTSMAGPHVVGQIALLWAAVPALKGNFAETTRIVTQTAKPTTSTQTCGGVPGSAIPNNTFGFGMIDAYRSVIVARDNAASR